MFRSLFVSAPLVVAVSVSHAADATPAMRAFAEANVMSWAMSPQAISAVNEQNAPTAGTPAAQIIAWDNE